MNYESAAAKLTGRNAKSRNLANNTKLIRKDEHTIVVRLHSTDILTFHDDGRTVYDSGGWKTVTTKARMNEFGPGTISQSKGLWSIAVRGTRWPDGLGSTRPSDWVPYADGITWDGKKWTGAGRETPKSVAKLTAKIKKFTEAYMAAFAQGKVPAPGPGDCFICQFSKGDKAFMGHDHLTLHMAEKYFVPSLLARAIERFPVAPAAMWYVSDKWAGTSNGEFARGYGEPALKKSLYRYMKEQLGVAA